jgi:CubicO group peptidase (beta-lactamase class C family)
MDELLRRRIEGWARSAGFSGAVRIDDPDGVRFESAYGLADRRFGVPNEITTRFAIASGMKGITALTVMSLIVSGRFELSTKVRAFLGEDLPAIDDEVTVEHLLAHRSGIGDYLDESEDGAVTDHVMPVPVHQLAAPEDYLPILDGRPQVFEPGRRFAYNNSGYVVLALICERAAGLEFADLIEGAVLEPAEMESTELLRSDSLPDDAATGYLEQDGLRTNVLHLPILGSGDGGIYSTVLDMRRLWSSMFEGRIVPARVIDDMTSVRSTSDTGAEYGLGFWLDSSAGAVRLEGYDAGVSFASCHHPEADITHTVVSNWSDGAWPLARELRALLHS